MLSTRLKTWGSLLLLSVTVITSCQPLGPRKLREKTASQVAVAFDPSALGELANQMKSLQIRIYKVTGETVGAQEGADQKLAIEAQKAEYVITGVKLGLKEFEVSILDASNQALGVGRIRHLVQPGLNKTPPLVIKLAPVSQPVASVGVELKLTTVAEQSIDSLVTKVALQWKAQNGGQTGELILTKGVLAVTHKDVAAALDEHCVGCHAQGAGAPFKKLDLHAFPFTSGLIAEQNALLDVFMNRIQNEDSPMPPGELMPAETIAKFKAWQAGGFLAEQPAGANDLFRGQLDGLKVTDKLVCTLVVSGADGVELLRKELEHVVTLNEAMKIEAALEIESPSVAIPVVVEPAGQ